MTEEIITLYHGTDNIGQAGIEERGFGLSLVGDSPEQSWFCTTKASTTTSSRASTWLVIVEMPAEVADRYRYRFEDGSPYCDNYLIPWDVVNGYRPFRFEQIGTEGDSRIR